MTRLWGREMHGAEGVSPLGSASWGKVGTAEIGGKDISGIWNSDKSIRVERPGLVKSRAPARLRAVYGRKRGM